MPIKQTRVVFRRWKRSPYTIIALFPDLDAGNGFIDSYEHIGQHGGADYTLVVRATTRCDAAEVLELARELERIGYSLKTVLRR